MADTPNEKNESQIPPKLNLKPNGTPPDASDGKEGDSPQGGGETIHIKMPGDADLAAPQPGRLRIRPETVKTVKAVPKTTTEKAEPRESTETAKRITSKIPLEEAGTEPSEGKGRTTQAPKTIRIRPITKHFKAPPTASAVNGVASQTASLDDKRKTSRISLDSVFKADTVKKPAEEKPEPREAVNAPAEEALSAPMVEAEAEPAEDKSKPKTIRLRRPGEAATIKMAKPPAATAPQPTKQDESEAQTILSKTSKLDIPEDEAETDASPTRRKTIRVKRPSESRGVTPEATAITVKRTEGPSQAPQASGQPEMFSMAPMRDELGAGFLVASIAALLAVCVAVYMMMAQTTGPNVCWTETSIWNGPFGHLSWPGKYIPSSQN